MQGRTFEAPVRSKWPLVVAGLLVAFCLAGWFWMSRGQTGGQRVVEGELMGESRDAANTGAGNRPAQVNAAQGAGTNPPPAQPEGAGDARADVQADDEQVGVDTAARDTSSGGMAVPEGAGAVAGAGGEEQATVASLLAQADEAYDAGDLFVALPLYKEAAVRIQVQINTTPYDSRREELENELRNLRELVRECEAQIRASQPEVDMASRTPHPAPQPGVIPELAIKDLGNFPYDDEKGGVPPDVAALDGTQIRLTGYMLPAFQTDQIKTFTLVADVYECCFGQPPGVEHMINVVLPEGKAVPFTYGEIQVTGTLRIVEERRDGYVINLFTIGDVTSVRATGRG